MAINYRINSMTSIGSDLLKIVYQYVLFDSAIVKTLYVPSSFTDATIKSIISAEINAPRIAPTAPPADPDANVVSVKAMEGQTYATAP